MAATFDPGLSNDISKVRQLIGDTDMASPEVQDETITAYRGTTYNLSILRTAIQLANDLAAKYAKVGDFSVDNQLNRMKTVSAQYYALAESLTVAAVKEEAAAGAGNGITGMMVTGLDDHRGPLQDCPLSSYDPWQC